MTLDHEPTWHVGIRLKSTLAMLAAWFTIASTWSAQAAPSPDLTDLIAQTRAIVSSSGVTDGDKIRQIQTLLNRTQAECEGRCEGVLETFRSLNEEKTRTDFQNPVPDATGLRWWDAIRNFASGRPPGASPESLPSWMKSTLERLINTLTDSRQVSPKVIATVELLRFVHNLSGLPSERVRALIKKAQERSDLAYLRLNNINVDNIPLEKLDEAAKEFDVINTALREARQVLLDPSVSDADKSFQIQALLQDFENLCTNNCSLVLDVVKQVNSIGQNSYEVGRAVRSGVQGDAGQSLSDLAGTVFSIARGADKLFAENPNLIKTHISAAIELLRYIVSMEQEAMFAILSQNTDRAAKGYAHIERDIKFFKGQIRALYAVADVIRASSKLSDGQKIPDEKLKEMITSINDLGLFYIKIAQTASNLSFMFNANVVGPLKVFQDSVPPVPPDQVVKTITEEFGQTPDRLFLDFDPANPIATGSIGNTYVVTTRREKRKILFKVQRPNLHEELNWNRKLNQLILKTAGVFTPQGYAPVLDFVTSQVMGLEDAVEEETDFRSEARNLSRFRRLFMFRRGVRIPRPYRRYTSKRCLGMEYLPGVNIDKQMDLQLRMDTEPVRREIRSVSDLSPSQTWALRELNHQKLNALESSSSEEWSNLAMAIEDDSTKSLLNLLKNMDAEKFDRELQEELKKIDVYTGLYTKIVGSFLYMLFAGGIHADLHPGNILSLMDGSTPSDKLGLVDWGHVAKTRGIVTQPLFAVYHFFMGNGAGFAKQMAKMNVDPGIDSDRMQEIAQSVFEKYKIERNSWLMLLKGTRHRHESNAIFNAFREFMARSHAEVGYRMSPRYAQLMRSLLPVVGLSASLGSRIPISKLLLTTGRELMLAIPMGTLHRLAVLFPSALGELADRSNDYRDYLIGKVRDLPARARNWRKPRASFEDKDSCVDLMKP